MERRREKGSGEEEEGTRKGRGGGVKGVERRREKEGLNGFSRMNRG